MKIWFLWIVLSTGQWVEGGQYQSEQACYDAAQAQRTFWIARERRALRMVCKAQEPWYPTRG